jgi:hypothetical protein
MSHKVIPLNAISMGILVGNTFYVYLEGHEYSYKIAQKEEWKCMEINALVKNKLSVTKGNPLFPRLDANIEIEYIKDLMTNK